MGTVSLPIGATNAGPNEWADVHGEDQAIIDEVNGGLDADNLAPDAVTTTKIADANVTDAKLRSPNNSAYRLIYEANGFLGGAAPSGTYLLGSETFNTSSTSVGMLRSTEQFGISTTSSGGAPRVFYFDDADYTVGGLTQKLRLRVQVACNATAPAINFTFGLYPVTIAGGANAHVFTTGTVVASSTVAVNAPSASTITSAATSDFTIPSDGSYMLCVALSGTQAANSTVSVHSQLQYRHV
jgi:hypothetical protein